jgi:homoserine O-acetyltransferase
MSNTSTQQNSVGIVQTQSIDIPLPEKGLELRNGGALHELTVAYEAYGKLSDKKDNVVHICHALTGDAHVAGRNDESDAKPGWWDDMVGPGKGIDTDYYYVICSNILGGCNGTTGPSSIDPRTKKHYGPSFPDITISDLVHVQKLFLKELGIDHLAAVIGASIGGMQVLEWSIQYPDSVDRCICIAASASLSTQALAFDAVARDAILSDPDWAAGEYHDKDESPDWGLAHARKIGHITYLSPEIMQKKFGREKTNKEEGNPDGHRFQVESYLDYQGKKLVERFDANSYIKLTGAVDSFDLAEEYGSLPKAFENVEAKFLIIALSSDWLFPPEQSIDISVALNKAGKQVSCCTLDAPHGHDAFLVDIAYLTETVKAFLPWVDISDSSPHTGKEDPRFSIIVEAVKKESRVLDLGCGYGELLSLLRDKKQVSGFGIEIDLDRIIKAIDDGHDIYHGDLDETLKMIPDKSYDYAILSSTLQVVKKPRVVLNEMLRIADEGIVTFPNFANWYNRLSLAFSGRMPKSRSLPHEWYDTPNIHLTTLKDFVELCKQEQINVIDIVCIPGHSLLGKLFIALGLRNLGAERVLVRINRKAT